MTAALLTIGTELTRGDLEDKNGRWLARRLSELGHEVVEICSVDDHEDRIVSCLQRLSSAHQLLIVTGGLGPTTDDLTSACAARAKAEPLVSHPASLQHIQELLAKRGREMTSSQAKQASFPASAEVLTNRVGIAPGFALRIGQALCFFTPGVPREMMAIFEDEILPRLPVGSEPCVLLRLRCSGLGESLIGDRLAGLEELHQVEVGYRASLGEVEVKLLAREKSGLRPAAERAKLAQDEARRRLVPYVYAEGEASLAEALLSELARQGYSLALAESCTGGGLSAELVTVPGASAQFLGAVVCYSNSVKTEVLGVSESTLRRHGAVSQETALEMALGARAVLKADFALSITGVAGPGGGSAEKPVGLVHFALVGPGGEHSFHEHFGGDRGQVQRLARTRALRALLDALRSMNS